MPLSARIHLLLVVLLAAGCVSVGRAPQDESPRTGTVQKEAPAAAAPAAVAPVVAPPQAVVKPDAGAGITSGSVEPVAPPAARPIEADAPAAKQDAAVTARPDAPAPPAPAAAPPARVPATPAPREPAPKPAPAVSPPPRPAPAPLDLAALEKRLKETDAIGVFTKLTLKNQVDDLLDQFKAYYQGRAKTTLAALRQPYDQLILKVLSLLQDSDPQLARAITESREAIWGILSDPNKFKNL